MIKNYYDRDLKVTDFRDSSHNKILHYHLNPITLELEMVKLMKDAEYPEGLTAGAGF